MTSCCPNVLKTLETHGIKKLYSPQEAAVRSCVPNGRNAVLACADCCWVRLS
ncbi:MAG: hypothetical protein QW297_03290 [Candidatus Jordarchaeales archaeon]